MDELATRLVPWADVEFAHARNRPHGERPELPSVGDRVWYRHQHWERDPVTGAMVAVELCTVVGRQSLDDRADANLWQPVRDPVGRPVLDDTGGQVFAPAPDPWPYLDMLRPDRVNPRGGFAGFGEVVRTREARVRGSAGWLPLDYRDRPERARLPADTARVLRPVVDPAIVRAGVGPG